MIEILMCTYNGEKYIEKQLFSLLNQTVQPDLVRIFDDKSTDNTIAIINYFIKEKNITNWIVKVNDVQKGWRRNFYDAIKESTGDIVFFCDQDDIWKEDKIEIMSNAIISNNLLRLSGMQYVIDENDNFIDRNDVITCPKEYNKRIKLEKYNSNIEHCVWKNRLGCAIAITKEMVQLLNYFEFVPFFAHDIWCVQLSSFLGKGAVIEYPCINYRVHSNNATAGFSLDITDKYEIKKYISSKCKESFEYFYNNLIKIKSRLSNRQYKNAKNIFNMISLRNEMFEKRSILIWIKLIRYLRFYPTKRTYFADILDLYNLR